MSIQLNIHNRLSLVLWGAALLAFILAGAGFALFHNLTLEHRVRQIMEPYAQLVSVGTDAAVAFEDPVRAQEILDTLRANPQILEAAIFLDDGRILASFNRLPDAHPSAFPTKPDGIYIESDAVELLQGLSRGAHLRLGMSLDQISQQTHQALWLFGAGLLVLLIATFGQLAVLRRTIVRPLASLTEATERVRALADYRHRVPASGTDEVARLGQSFNAMMEAIQERELELRRLSVFQRTILDNVAYGIVSTTPEGLVTSFNPAAQRLLGYTADEIIGKQTPATWHDPEEIALRALQLSEELGETVAPGFDVFTARPRRNLPEENEWTFIHKDGTRIPVNLSITALRDESGEINGFVGLTYDLTERKLVELRLNASEQEFRTLAENSPDVIIRYDREGRRIYVNPEFERVNHLSAQQVLGKTLAEVSTELAPKVDVFTEQLMGAMASGTAAKIDLSWTKDGKPICWFVRVIPEFNEDGKVMSALTIWSDISERKQAEEELRYHKEQLEETVQQRTKELLVMRDAAEAANKAKSVFLANMSHELRTPLNAILGFSSMMRRDPLLTDSQSENLDIINRSGGHLLSLINDVLEMAKIEAGHLQLEVTAFDLGSLVREVTEMMQIRAQEKGLRLVLDQSSEFPRYIRSDEARIRQILINLINNAVKFTDRGGVTVRLKVKNNARHHLLIEVEDSGPGIAQEDQSRLFEPFVQLSEAGTQRGTGLGLTITRQFVQMMGGSIGVESTLGKGSIFRVDLPVELAKPADILQPETRKPGEVVGLAPGQPLYKIMIVEDQRENQLLLSQLMTDLGLEVKVVENGQQCLDLFYSWHPDLIWMDRRMPVMDGIEATRRLRQLPDGQSVKIVAVTASAFKEQQQEMLDAGMDDFVRKPYRFEEIYDCLARQLGLEYIYQSGETLEHFKPAELTPVELAELPRALRDSLRDALQTLDSERIAAAIGRIGEIDATLGLALSRLADYFDYPGILMALDRADNCSQLPEG